MPSFTSVRCLVASTALQVVSLVLQIASLVSVLQVSNMRLYSFDPDSNKTVALDVTTYVQIVAAVSLGVNALACFLALLNAMLAWMALSRLLNQVDRRAIGHMKTVFVYDMPDDLVKMQTQEMMP